MNYISSVSKREQEVTKIDDTIVLMDDTQQEAPVLQEPFASQDSVPQAPDIEPISWSASEYVAHEKTTAWYAALFAGGTVLVVIVYLVTRDIFASAVVLLICSAMSVFAGRKPSTKNYVVHSDGFQIDEKFHPYSNFRSFSVVEEGPINSIWLRPLKRFAPTVVMYFSAEDEDKIVDGVGLYLSYEQNELDTIDKISKRMRF